MNSRREVLRTVRGIAGQEDILKATPLIGIEKILDIGLGGGEATEYFLDKGKKVFSIGLNVRAYCNQLDVLIKRKAHVLESKVEMMPFENEIFDAVWMSHILEHTLNPGLALRRVWSVLRDEGWLFIMVPPYKSKIVGGHVMTGWSIGQLMYVLLLSGFDVKHGHFVKHGYNICAFVRKTQRSLPELSYDKGDIERLSSYWPRDFQQGFEGDISDLNWIGFPEGLQQNYPKWLKRFAKSIKRRLKFQLRVFTG
jgi:SAM-dependent methyltransferase